MAVSFEKIRDVAERVAKTYGLEVVEVEMVGGGKNRVLTVYLEKNAAGRAQMKAELERRIAAVQAGEPLAESEDIPERLLKGHAAVEQLSFVTHEDCANFSREFGVILDVEELVPGNEYTLEASSPGLDRKLSKLEDFDRFAGSLVKLQTYEPIANNRHWQGRLIAGKPGVVTVDLGAVKQNSKSKKTGVKQVEIEPANIEKARLVAEI
jgi:ribosome maturation factor RimP